MILSGKEVADQIEAQIAEKIHGLPTPPKLAVVLLGSHPSSETYVRMKSRAAARVGIEIEHHCLPSTTSQETLLTLVDTLNHDLAIDGILVQLPLPEQIDAPRVIEAIDPKKDVDGFHPVNMGKLLLGLEGGFVPCTPLGIQKMLQYYKLSCEGKHVVIVGRSNIVGKPLAALLMQNKPFANATVSVAHSRTKELKKLTQTADILVAAIGSAHFITAEHVKEGAIVIDVGINRLQNPARLVGDVDFTSVEKKCMAITPVPGGVGPMTVAMLLSNTARLS